VIYNEEGTLKGYLVSAWKVTFPALLISLGINFISGAFLGKYFDKLMISYPVLLVVLPGLMGLRGNIFGSLASRFATSLYIGEMEPDLKSKKIGENIYMSIILSLIPLFLLWIIGTVKTMHLDSAINSLMILVVSTVFVSLILGYSTAGITIIPFRRGLDPDSIASPLVTSIADLVTIPTLIFFILMFEFHMISFDAILVLSLLALLLMAKKFRFDKKIFLEITGTLLLLSAISSVSGGLLESYSDAIHRSAMVSVIYPALIGSLGNYGGVVAAKTSTRLHVGSSELIKKQTIAEITSLSTTAVLTASIIAVSGYLVTTRVLNRHVLFFPELILLYIPIAIGVMILSSIFARIFHRFGLDPDNISIPVITTVADLIGTVFAIYIAILIT